MTDLAQDNQSAKEAGLSYGKWRASQEIYPLDFKNKKHVITDGGFDLTLFCELYNSGLLDRDIATRMGSKEWFILRFRKAKKLPHNRITKEALEARPKITVDSLEA